MTERIKVLVERTLNPNLREYHVKARISTTHIDMFYFPLGSDSAEDLANVGPVGKSIVEHLNTLDGIEQVFITPYSITVSKCAAYDWKDIETDILFSLEQALGQSIDVTNL